jgi:glycosyltransferase involved in cell wall biosynthesis
MESISATLITRNEETNIEDALRSLSWAEEIVVVDCGSTDATVDICRRHTDRVFTRAWTGFVDQKHHAVEKAGHDWIFSLDADERVTPALASEIGRLRQAGFQHHGYRIPRVACFSGRWIRHGDWYPDHQLRLFDRRRGRWQGGRVHESVRVDGVPGLLRGEIQHYTYRSLSDYLRRLETYSTLAAQDYHQQGKRASMAKVMANPPAAFVKAYLLKRGFLDGAPGLMVAVMGAISVFFKYSKLYELQKRRPEENGSTHEHR